MNDPDFSCSACSVAGEINVLVVLVQDPVLMTDFRANPPGSCCYYRRIIICLNMEILKSASDVGGRIGDPIPFAQAQQGVVSFHYFFGYLREIAHVLVSSGQTFDYSM